MDMAYLIEIEVEYDSGISPRKGIDLYNNLQEIGINPSQLKKTYTASYAPNTTNDPKNGINQQYSWASGGQIFGSQPIIHNTQIKVKQTSFNIILRFDNKEKIWNIDLVVHIDDLGVHSFNLSVSMPSVYDSPEGLPYVARIVDRGSLFKSTADFGTMELYGENIISSDPFRVIEDLRKRFY